MPIEQLGQAIPSIGKAISTFQPCSSYNPLLALAVVEFLSIKMGYAGHCRFFMLNEGG
ncbi:MAG: hypothetical protein LBQ77_01370 [Treponema sp.]|jgi:hypothetical protein|nr:hypothetical protein [Treponema sp.]